MWDPLGPQRGPAAATSPPASTPTTDPRRTQPPPPAVARTPGDDRPPGAPPAPATNDQYNPDPAPEGGAPASTQTLAEKRKKETIEARQNELADAEKRLLDSGADPAKVKELARKEIEGKVPEDVRKATDDMEKALKPGADPKEVLKAIDGITDLEHRRKVKEEYLKRTGKSLDESMKANMKPEEQKAAEEKLNTKTASEEDKKDVERLMREAQEVAKQVHKMAMYGGVEGDPAYQKLKAEADAKMGAAMQRAISAFDINDSNVPKVEFAAGLQDRGGVDVNGVQMSAKSLFKGGDMEKPGAELSVSGFASALGHEIEGHYEGQIMKGKFPDANADPAAKEKAMNVNEVEAYDYNLKNAKRFGNTEAEVKDFEKIRGMYHSQLPAAEQAQTNAGNYPLPAGVPMAPAPTAAGPGASTVAAPSRKPNEVDDLFAGL